MTITTIFVFIIILSVLVLIHELGHFLVAKKLGVKVEEFGAGFPPRVFGKKIGETIYSINLLPIGGFVKLYGEDEAGGGSIRIKHGEVGSKNKKRAFFARPVWQRGIIVLAGVIMNFLLALVIISYLFAVQGAPIPGNKVFIASIAKNSPADMSGLMVNDIIAAVNGVRVTNPKQIQDVTKAHLGRKLTITVIRGKKKFDVFLIPRVHPPANEGAMGIVIRQDVFIKKYPWYQAPFVGTWEALQESWMILSGLGTLLAQVVTQRTVPKELAGPVGIAQLTGQFVQIGPFAVLSLVSLLSLNLAVLNVLPIPALDGGRLFFILIEGMTGYKVNQKFETYAHTIGMIVLLTLIALITFHDVTRLIHGESLLPKP